MDTTFVQADMDTSLIQAKQDTNTQQAALDTTQLPPDNIAAQNRELSAEERIQGLLGRAGSRKKILLSAISFCDVPRHASLVNLYIDELQQDNTSVYSASTLCSWLEEVGALEKCSKDGGLLSGEEPELETVFINGVEYLEAGEPEEVYYLATAPGLAAIEADDPSDRLRETLEEDRRYLAIYKRILTMCAAESGASLSDINSAVKDDPLLKKPRISASYFIEKLESCDALTWRKVWFITVVGNGALEQLEDIQDDFEAKTNEEV